MELQDSCLSALDGAENSTCVLNDQVPAYQLLDSVHTTAVQWAPNVFFLAVVPFYMIYLMTRGKEQVDFGRISQSKMAIIFLLASLTTVQLFRDGNQDFDELIDTQATKFLAWARIGTFILMALVMKLENSRGYTTSVPSFLFWLLMLGSSCVSVYTDIINETYETDFNSFVLSLSSLAGVVIQLALFTMQDEDKETKVRDSEKSVHPEDDASFLSKVFLEWVSGLVKTGYKKTLEMDDVPDVPLRDSCTTGNAIFEEAWKKEEEMCARSRDMESSKQSEKGKDMTNGMTKADTKPTSDGKSEKQDDTEAEALFSKFRPSIVRALMRAFGLQYFTLQIIKCVLEVSNFLSPLLFEALIKYVQNRDVEPVWKGYVLVLSVFIVDFVKDTLHMWVWTLIVRLCRRMNAALKMTVYKKALCATNESKKNLTSGEIVSLMGEDVDKLVGANYHLFLVIQLPIKVSLAIYLLYCQLGMATFVGLAIMLSLIPLNTMVGRRLQRFEKEKNGVKDDRIKVMNEVLNGIKVLKLYAWEKSFMGKIKDIRNKETDIGSKIYGCHACIDLMFRAVPFLVRIASLMIFLTYGGFLDPAIAFVSASLFHMLNEPFNFMALIVPNLVQASESAKRLNKFLNNKDIPEDIVKSDSSAKTAIEIKDGTFTWDKSAEKVTLEKINLTIPKGSLVAVVGSVGSGKSSVLSAMLGEMEKLEGNVCVQSSTAYVAQEAWIRNETLRDNILFGSEFQSRKYHKVISACALKNDFKILAASDRTEIGEKGINLSGGQKQRVSLARAVYSDSDIYLFDDPLSAVDAHVGKHIFNRVIGHNGMLKEKTRVLVTHGVHWLPFVDNIIVMKEGKISETGTYKELLSHDGAFAQFLKEVFTQDDSASTNDTEVKQVKKNMFTRLQSLNEAENTEKPIVIDSHEEEKSVTIDKEQPPSSSSDESDNEKDKKYVYQRQETVLSDEEWYEELTGKDEEKKGNIIDEEETEFGTVAYDVYKQYGEAVGAKYIALFVVMFTTLLVSREMKNLWLGKWTEDSLISNSSMVGTPEYTAASWRYLITFSLIGSVEVVMAYLFVIVLHTRAFQAANQIHESLLSNILQLPMSFFDTTPTGRIITRFSKDIGCVDGLGGCLGGYIRCLGNLIVHLLMITIITPQIIVFLIPITMIFLHFQRMYSPSSRQLRRYRSKSSAPMFSHFKESLHGTDTIRAYKCQDRFITQMGKTVDKHMKFDLMEIFVGHWLRMKLDILGDLVALAAGIIVVFNTGISPTLAGLVLMNSYGFVGALAWFMYHSSHTEQELVSLERVIEYSGKPTEAPWEIAESAPSPDWPESGEIVLDDYKARYREGLDLVLKGVTCNIRQGEKVGIVGRTGAGKSSLTVALFRLVEAAGGNISIDGHEISVLGLHDLRKKITILPQDPVIFGGSLRMNLDPFNEKTTEELWEALKHSHLMTFVESLPDKLDYDCGEGGKNLSVGQRQLVCLARTLLRKTKVLVLDEATAAVDMETDDLIQKTICSEFKDCTVLTIAHRLNTIVEYDRILVLDQGQIREFDSPKTLLADTNSLFYSMAKDAKLV